MRTMRMLNRNAIVVKPKQPYLDWANALDRLSEVHATDSEEIPVYLIPEFDTPGEYEAWLRANYHLVAESELRAEWEDEADWPVFSGYPMFLEWFDVQFGSEVFDLGAARLRVEDA